MKRILFISNYQSGVGGINSQVDLLNSYINQEINFESKIFSTKGNPFKRCWKFLQLLLIVGRYDVLHIHACSYWGMLPVFFGVIAGKLNSKKIVITYHGGEAEKYFAKHAAFVQRWLCRADVVIVLSEFLKDIFDQYSIPCTVIPNIVKLQTISTNQKQVVSPRFISIRHLEPLYNIHCILQAYEQVTKIYPNATLDILGQGSQRIELESYVQEHNLNGVKFLGQVSNEKIYEYFTQASIMISAPKIDNMPVSILEAMNVGLLVISSKVGGVPYMITHRKTGLLFESENVEQLVEQMLWALEHSEEVKQMIGQAQADVQKYSWENVRPQLMKVYE